MNVTETEAQKLLKAATTATERHKRLLEAQQEKASKSAQARRDAVLAAVEADIPRQRIADAIGVKLARLHQIIRNVNP